MGVPPSFDANTFPLPIGTIERRLEVFQRQNLPLYRIGPAFIPFLLDLKSEIVNIHPCFR